MMHVQNIGKLTEVLLLCQYILCGNKTIREWSHLLIYF